jgi:hypothetical protein
MIRRLNVRDCECVKVASSLKHFLADRRRRTALPNLGNPRSARVSVRMIHEDIIGYREREDWYQGAYS